MQDDRLKPRLSAGSNLKTKARLKPQEAWLISPLPTAATREEIYVEFL